MTEPHKKMVMMGMLVVESMVVAFTILVEWNVLKISSADAMETHFLYVLPLSCKHFHLS
jgi:hypothetical protein